MQNLRYIKNRYDCFSNYLYNGFKFLNQEAYICPYQVSFSYYKYFNFGNSKMFRKSISKQDYDELELY